MSVLNFTIVMSSIFIYSPVDHSYVKYFVDPIVMSSFYLLAGRFHSYVKYFIYSRVDHSYVKFLTCQEKPSKWVQGLDVTARERGLTYRTGA